MAKKADGSPKLIQRDKIKDQFEIRNFEWTDKQKAFIEIALKKETQIVFLKSPPGTGKTLLSLYCSLVLLNEKRIGEIVYLRSPIESCSRGLGYLAGTAEIKLQAYLTPLYDQLNQLLKPNQINNLVNEKRITSLPIGFIKGATFHNKAIIADEAEDLTIQEFLLTMGRLGKFSKMFLIGDEKQANIKNSGFTKVFNSFNTEQARSNGIFCFEFTKDDIMRAGLLRFIVEVFENM